MQRKHRIPEHHTIQDVATRWNSTFYMLERITEQKTALVEYVSPYELPMTTANQWKLSKTMAVQIILL